ncbi:hypothetical protein ACQKJ1_27295 [Methylorubrum rhodesianum]|uniref:hypothetical protein n=1 Tax=Methylorubrum rhodesianum TaxID=29427 RepID=UPI003D036DA7
MGRGRHATDSVDMLAYERPSPEKAHFIATYYGMDAALERWPFLTANAISKIVQVHNENERARTGVLVRPSRRTTTPEQEEAAIKAVFELGSPSRASKATGLTYTLILTLLRERGISDYPKVPGSERGRLSAEAKARKALAPPAVTPVTQETAMPFAPRVRSVPADDVIRAHHAETPRVADLAKRWSVTPACVYQHLRRLGLSSRPAAEASVPALPAPAPAPAPEVTPSNVVPFEAPHTEPAPAPVPARAAAQWDLAFPSRLGLEDLVLAVALAQRTGLGPAEAIRFVRADAAAARPA